MPNTELHALNLTYAIALSVMIPIACTSSAGHPSQGGNGNTGGSSTTISDSSVTDARPDASAPALPLHTDSRWIMDANNHRFKLASVNWYGAESPDLVPAGLDRNDMHSIARLIKQFGFNSVRIPWALQLIEEDPVIADKFLSSNLNLSGKHALEILDAVIDALAQENLVVILDNHRSRGDWCCDTLHGDGLWHTAEYPESQWIADWRSLAQRYKSQPAVVGMDLRNELRAEVPDSQPGCVDCDSPADAGCACLQPSWGDGNSETDWPAAAERGGNAILEENSSLLIIVEGNFWSTWFGASYRPVNLSVANRLVYSPHNYSSSNGGVGSFTDYSAFKAAMDSAWGFIITENQAYTAPLWLGEFGTNHTTPSPVWWPWIRQYISDNDLDWAVWALNGTEGSGYSRTFGAEETFGVLNTEWNGAATDNFLSDLQAMMPARLGP